MDPDELKELARLIDLLSLHHWEIDHRPNGRWSVSIWQGEALYGGGSDDGLVPAIEAAIADLRK